MFRGGERHGQGRGGLLHANGCHRGLGCPGSRDCQEAPTLSSRARGVARTACRARHYQSQGLGGILLADALRRTARPELGVFAMVVDAKDEAAQRFYEHYGFTLLPGETRRLCLPIAAALQRLAARRS